MSKVISTTVVNPNGKEDTCAYAVVDSKELYYLLSLVTAPDKYTISFFIKSLANETLTLWYGEESKEFEVTTSWQKITWNFSAAWVDNVMLQFTEGEYYIYNTMLERGNVATDYSMSQYDQKKVLKDMENTLNTKYAQLSIALDDITLEVSETSSKLGNVESSVKLMSDEIGLKVNKNGIIGAINLSSEQAQIMASKIDLVGAVTLSSLSSDVASKFDTLDDITVTDNNITYIDGGKIYTGSITADKIDVDDLFAQDITATGSITGATLVSLENNSSKVVIDKGEVAIYDFDTRGEGGFYKVGSVFASGGGMVSASGAWIFESLSTELGNDVDEIAARLNKITQRNFILIGDSYLDGQTPEGDIDSWGVYLKNLLPAYSFSIHAIRGSGFGNTTSGKNFLDALKKYTGDKSIITDIIVCGGFNDAATSITTNAVLNGINNFTTYVENNFANAKVHIGYVGATNKGELLEQIKEAIRIYRACGSKRCGYISNMEYILRNTQFFTSDGVHPNQIGQKNIAWNLASYLTTGNVSVIQEKEDCKVVKPSTVTTGIALYTGLNNSTASLYHPKTEQLTFTGLSAIKMNGAEGSRVTLGTLTNSSIIGNQTTSSVATSTANASVSVPINVKTSNGWYTGIGTLEIINLNVLLRVNVLNGNNYLKEVVADIIIPPFTATFDSLDV